MNADEAMAEVDSWLVAARESARRSAAENGLSAEGAEELRKEMERFVYSMFGAQWGAGLVRHMHEKHKEGRAEGTPLQGSEG